MIDQKAKSGFTILHMAPHHVDSFWHVLDTVAREQRWLGSTQAPPIEHLREAVLRNIELGNPQIVAVIESGVVGWCDIARPANATKQHVAGVGMGVHPDHRGKGIGKALMVEALAESDRVGIGRVELTVYTHNVVAKSLYESLGFETEGLLKHTRFINGTYFDAYEMARFNQTNLDSYAAGIRNSLQNAHA